MNPVNLEPDRLTVESHDGNKIIFVDYSGLKEKPMIELINSHRALALTTRLPFIADFHNTYVTPEYIKAGKKFIELTKELNDNGAFLGVDAIKIPILKGVAMMYGVNYRAFDSKEKAVQFLINKGPT